VGVAYLSGLREFNVLNSLAFRVAEVETFVRTDGVIVIKHIHMYN